MVTIEDVKRRYGCTNNLYHPGGFVYCSKCPLYNTEFCDKNEQLGCNGLETAWKRIQKYLNEKEGITNE